jgi:hypothetical protein
MPEPAGVRGELAAPDEAEWAAAVAAGLAVPAEVGRRAAARVALAVPGEALEWLVRPDSAWARRRRAGLPERVGCPRVPAELDVAPPALSLVEPVGVLALPL